jgi:hypothetical protein
MPKFLAAFALVMVLATPAFALTTERGGTNSDGSAKFSDPDEQRPGFMNGATEDEGTGQAQGGQMQLTPNSHVGLSVNRFGAQQQQQQDAFDQAYSHK